jgi:hypothetical protein
LVWIGNFKVRDLLQHPVIPNGVCGVRNLSSLGIP